VPSLQRAVAPFPALLEPPEELELPLPDDPPDVPPLLPEPAAAALAVTVTFTLTVFVAVAVAVTVDVGAGVAVSVAVAVAVAVTVTAGCTLVAAAFASLPLSWPLAPMPTPRKRASPSDGNTYRFRAHFGAVLTGGCGGMAYGLVICPPEVVEALTVAPIVKKACDFRVAVTYS
jgi:hypothetical protein